MYASSVLYLCVCALCVCALCVCALCVCFVCVCLERAAGGKVDDVRAMSEARPLTDFLKSNDQYAKSRARFTENELASTVVKDVYEGLERYNCCYCGHFCAILNEKLEVLPKRSTDGSTAVAKKHVLKQRLAEGEKKRIKRPKGIETQYRMLCPGCNLFVAYRSTPKVSAAKYIYICEDSLTQKATVLHVEGSDELSTGVVSNTLVPKSVQNGREPETVRLVIRPQTGSDRSCVRKLNDEAVFIDLECPPGSEEEAVNAELRRYLCLVLDKVRRCGGNVHRPCCSFQDKTCVIVEARPAY